MSRLPDRWTRLRLRFHTRTIVRCLTREFSSWFFCPGLRGRMSHNAIMGARAQAPHCSNLGCTLSYGCRSRVIPRIHDIMLVLLSKNNCLRTCAPCLPTYGLSEAVRRYSSPRSCLCPIHPRYRLAHRDSVMVYTYQRRRWK